MKKILAKITDEPKHLNTGNSIRVMESYLKEYILGDYGIIESSVWFPALKAEDLLKREASQISKYFLPLELEAH